MPAPDLSRRDSPLGPYRDKRIVPIGTDDYENGEGFTCQVASAGSLTYRTLEGLEDLTEPGLSVGDTIVGPGGIPVVLRAVRGKQQCLIHCGGHPVTIAARFFNWWSGRSATASFRPPVPPAVPSNALTWGGQALTWDGQVLTWGDP